MVQVNNVKISELPTLSSPASDIIVPVVSAGVTSSITKRLLVGCINVRDYGVATTNTAAQNNTPVANAVSAAALAGAELFWPEGTYLTSATIPNFHSVRHRGPGAVGRSGGVFYVEPKTGQTNRLYVATTGSLSNDGLSSTEPMLTPQVAFTALKNYGPVLDGSWQVILAAGTYSLHSQTFETPSVDWVVVKGPDVSGHPNVPTAILDGSGFAANQHGFIIGVGGSPPGIAVWFQDIKCQDYNAGATNSCGWSQGYGARCIYVNCHASNCDFAGILADQGDICLVKGGIIDGCRDGIVLNATKGTVGYSSPFTQGDNTIIQNCTEFGVYWSRGAQGHIDNCLFDNNPYHVRIESAARCHILGCDFKNATTAAISTNTDGSYYDDVSEENEYNDGTADANTKRYAHFAFTGNQQNWTDVAVSEMCIYAENPGSSLTSATKAQVGADLVLPDPTGANPGDLRPFFFVDKKTIIRIKVWGDTPNATASFGVDFYDGSSTVVMAYSAFVGTPSAAGFEYELVIAPLTATTQRGYVRLQGSAASPRLESGATAADMKLPQTIRLMAQSASGAVVVRRVEVWVSG